MQTALEKPDWIFFDLDGTLADSLAVMWEGYERFLTSYQITPTQTEFDRLNGPSLPEIVALLKEWHQLPETPEILYQQYVEGLAHTYAHTVKPMPGATEILLSLRQEKISLGLVTSGIRQIAQPFVERMGWQHLFSVMVFGDEVAQSKPHPAIYQLAMERAGTKKGWAIEDSANGSQSAARAGLTVFTLHPQPGHSQTLAIPISNLAAIWPKLTSETRYRVLQEGEVEVNNQPGDAGETLERHREAVTQIWEEEKNNRQGQLYEGTIFRQTGWEIAQDQVSLNGHFAPYSYFLARYRKPGLPYDFHPVSVTGICLAQGKALLAKRGNMTQYPHCWELVPSGGLEPETVGSKPGKLAIEAQILAELHEETGISPEWVDQLHPLGLILNDESGVYCLAYAIVLKDIPPADMKPRTAEYTRMEWVTIEELEAYFSPQANDFVPVSQALPQLCAKKGLI